MGITAHSGPHIVFGLTQSSTGQVMEYNEERGPSLYDLGYAMADPRPFYSYDPGSPVGTKALGFFHARALVDYVPSAVSTNAITAITSAWAAGQTFTVTANASAGVVATTIVAPESGLSVTTFAIGSTTVAAPYTAYGSGATVACWNSSAGTGRCLTISPTSNLDAGTWTIAGRDMYGYKMTETITSSGGAKTSQKAFKYVDSISASTTISSTGLQIGISDTFGFPAYCDGTSPDVYYNIVSGTRTTAIAVSTGPITLGATATATSTTGDVRGTYASTTATNGVLRIQMRQNFTNTMASAVSAGDTSPFFGQTQYSSI